MAKVLLTMQYEIEEGKREEYLATVQELKQHYAGNSFISYEVFEQKGKRNSFSEIFRASSEEAYAQFKETEDDKADALAEKLGSFLKDGKAKYSTFVEIA